MQMALSPIFFAVFSTKISRSLRIASSSLILDIPAPPLSLPDPDRRPAAQDRDETEQNKDEHHDISDPLDQCVDRQNLDNVENQADDDQENENPDKRNGHDDFSFWPFSGQRSAISAIRRRDSSSMI